MCYLLGIREPEQLRLHPLRGAIFESWMVSEIYKPCPQTDKACFDIKLVRGTGQNETLILLSTTTSFLPPEDRKKSAPGQATREKMLDHASGNGTAWKKNSGAPAFQLGGGIKKHSPFSDG